MTFAERGIVFDCAGDRLIGVLAEPSGTATDLGIVIVVGGPQYRAGSHRQFVHLSRALAAQGWPVLRFDYRGMGDSEGLARTFENVDEDIRAAIDALTDSCRSVRRVALWGLCDGASAAMMYAGTDARVAALVLANPWVRDPQTEAITQVKHYYGGRLLSGAFWRKLVSGGVDVGAATRETARAFVRAFGPGRTHEQVQTFQQRMLAGLRTHQGPKLLLLSGNDLTAKEFLERVGREFAWSAGLEGPNCERLDFSEADHTFSRADWKAAVAAGVGRWLART
ncbi:MAG: hydrolase 1, exosortase A system-associated [Betaproteobacteria bacterium]